MLYRAWAEGLAGRTDLNLWQDVDRNKTEIHVDLREFLSLALVDQGIGVSPEAALGHTIPGLIRVGLLDDRYSWGERKDSPIEIPLIVRSSVPGIELFGWALGEADFRARDLMSVEAEWDASLPHLSQFVMPKLPPLEQEQPPQGVAEPSP